MTKHKDVNEELPPDYSWHGSVHKEPEINPEEMNDIYTELEE